MGYYKNNDGELLKVAGSSLYADNPIGTILAFGGSEIPVGWHLCDGTAVSRTAYAELFAIIGTNFGVGDGSTTFNLPDLQGEFLRGAGTNSHTDQGDGANVGVHQDATEIPTAWADTANLGIAGNTTGDSQPRTKVNPDSEIYYSNTARYAFGETYSSSPSSDVAFYTSRPTNTSVNYIIKLKPVAFPSDVLTQIGDALSYSTAEKLTGGRWIDGKPIYQKTIFTDSSSKELGAISNIDTIVDMRGYIVNNTDGNRLNFGYESTSCAVRTNGTVYIDTGYTIRSSVVTLQYTKTTD